MPRTPDPRLNASLIREGRMIFQHLQQIFGNRQPRTTNFNDVMIAEAQAKATKIPQLLCGQCMLAGADKPFLAVTVIDGNALCGTHVLVVTNKAVFEKEATDPSLRVNRER